MGNELFEKPCASMACLGRGRLVGRALGDAAQVDANEKAAMQAPITRLNFPIAIAYIRISKPLRVGQTAG